MSRDFTLVEGYTIRNEPKYQCIQSWIIHQKGRLFKSAQLPATAQGPAQNTHGSRAPFPQSYSKSLVIYAVCMHDAQYDRRLHIAKMQLFFVYALEGMRRSHLHFPHPYHRHVAVRVIVLCNSQILIQKRSEH